jgi:pyruvate/2-oxoglutarate dehydrogenase complex dihydrolipoamide dehydrogenase (E3) component
MAGMVENSSPDPRSYDVVVVGGGPVGENVAARAHRGGLTACIVETHLVGGECSYYACTPSKAMLRPVHLRSATTRVRGVRPAELDVPQVLARRDAKIDDLDDHNQAQWVHDEGLDLLRGHGRLAGPRRVEVTAPDGSITVLEARHAVVLATGSTAAIPPIPGLREARPWTNREATTAHAIPGRLIVLGGGVVACEMAQAYAGLGATVTLVEREERLLARTEDFAGELVGDGLRAAGIDVRLGVDATGVKRDHPNGEVTVELADGTTVTGDEVLAALGRLPASSDLGLETVGLEAGDYVEVDETMLASGVEGGWLYAAGDVNGRNLLTHMGKYQARVCGDVIAARATGKPDDGPALRAIADHVGAPQVIFTDPEVATVGITSSQAREAGIDIEVVDVEMSSASGAGQLADNYVGSARLVVDQARRVVLGATFVGQDTAEMAHAATIAVIGEVSLDRLWHAVPSFPTMSEVWLRLLEKYGL